MKEQQEEFLKYFREMQVRFSKYYTRILIQKNLTLPQFSLLVQLSMAGEIPMTQISERLYVTKPAVTHLVDRLEKHKFVKRVPHPKDRRIHLLQLQPKGQQLILAIQGQIFEHFLKALDAFDSESRATIIKFYSMITETIDHYLGGPSEKKDGRHS